MKGNKGEHRGRGGKRTPHGGWFTLGIRGWTCEGNEENKHKNGASKHFTTVSGINVKQIPFRLQNIPHPLSPFSHRTRHPPQFNHLLHPLNSIVTMPMPRRPHPLHLRTPLIQRSKGDIKIRSPLILRSQLIIIARVMIRQPRATPPTERPMHILRTREVAKIRCLQDFLPGPQGFQRGCGGDPGFGICADCGAGQERESGPALETDEPALDDGAGDAAAGVAVVNRDDREAFRVLVLRP